MIVKGSLTDRFAAKVITAYGMKLQFEVKGKDLWEWIFSGMKVVNNL